MATTRTTIDRMVRSSLSFFSLSFLPALFLFFLSLRLLACPERALGCPHAAGWRPRAPCRTKKKRTKKISDTEKCGGALRKRKRAERTFDDRDEESSIIIFLIFSHSFFLSRFLSLLKLQMQLPHPAGGLHRFFKPVCSVNVGVTEEEARAEKGKENVDCDDETEIDTPAASGSPPPRPLVTKPFTEAAAALGSAPSRVTYSRRNKTKRPSESDADKDAKGDCSVAPIPTTTTEQQQRPPSSAPPTKKKHLTQTHLDLGQAAFICLTCPQCGMVYAPGDKGDEKLHSSFHADALQGPRLFVGSGASCSCSSSAASSSSSLIEVVSFLTSDNDASKRGGGKKAPPSSSSSLVGRVLHAPPGPRLGGAGVRRALAVAEAALGAAPGWLLGVLLSSRRGDDEGGGGGGGGAATGGEGEGGDGCGGGGGEPGSPPRRAAAAAAAASASSSSALPPRPLPAAALAACGKHAFFFECPVTKRAVGIAVVEALASGTRLRRVSGGGGGGEGGEEGTETTATTATTETTAGAAGAALGVRGVWVAPSHRRRGIATALLDAARARAVAYTVVGQRRLVVFSQPTDAGGGRALARSYAGDGGRFLSYL